MSEPLKLEDLFEDGITDCEFVKTPHTYTFPVPALSEEQLLRFDKGIRNFMQDNEIEIKREDGKIRKLDPVQYANALIENTLEVVDRTENYHDKLDMMYNIRYRISDFEKFINKYDNRDFNKVLIKVNNVIDHIGNCINNLKSRLEFEIISTKQLKKKASKTPAPDNKNYSHRQIAVAYFCMGEMITLESAEDILRKYSQTRSVDKLLQKRITVVNEIIGLSENKSTDTKKWNDLKAAKRLMSGIKNNEKAIAKINHYIASFELKYTGLYGNNTTH
jgi:hypothetical protein